VRPPLIVGNWKMHMVPSRACLLAQELKGRLAGIASAEVALAPPFTSLERVGTILKGSPLALAAQNVHWEPEGPFTGEVSALMLREIGCSYVIVGHSERRQHFGDTEVRISAKVKAVLSSQMSPILCVGEKNHERASALTFEVIEGQVLSALKGVNKNGIREVIIAYEPVWAIGTGNTATPEQVADVHRHIRSLLESSWSKEATEWVRILYGGSVTPGNAGALMEREEIDGLLVGGASLIADAFEAIIRSRENALC
jgi:triosephosphate isomerase